MAQINDLVKGDVVSIRNRFLKGIAANKIDILRVLLWGFSIAVVIVKAYWGKYLDSSFLMQYGIPYTNSVNEWIPRLQLIDYFFILLVNIVAGVLIVDLEKIVIHWIVSNVLSVVFSVIWGSLFIWYTLGAGEIYSALGLWDSISYITRFAFLNVFRMIFPFALISSFLACIWGAMISERFRLRG